MRKVSDDRERLSIRPHEDHVSLGKGRACSPAPPGPSASIKTLRARGRAGARTVTASGRLSARGAARPMRKRSALLTQGDCFLLGWCPACSLRNLLSMFGFSTSLWKRRVSGPFCRVTGSPRCSQLEPSLLLQLCQQVRVQPPPPHLHRPRLGCCLLPPSIPTLSPWICCHMLFTCEGRCPLPAATQLRGW